MIELLVLIERLNSLGEVEQDNVVISWKNLTQALESWNKSQADNGEWRSVITEVLYSFDDEE